MVANTVNSSGYLIAPFPAVAGFAAPAMAPANGNNAAAAIQAATGIPIRGNTNLAIDIETKGYPGYTGNVVANHRGNKVLPLRAIQARANEILRFVAFNIVIPGQPGVGNNITTGDAIITEAADVLDMGRGNAGQIAAELVSLVATGRNAARGNLKYGLNSDDANEYSQYTPT